jgi:hypothetical protein
MMVPKISLDDFDIWCPLCGGNLASKYINGNKITYCIDIFNCNYYKIDSTNIDGEIEVIEKFEEFIKNKQRENFLRIQKEQSEKRTNIGTVQSQIDIDESLETVTNYQKEDINLIMSILNPVHQEKSKMELYREKSKIKRATRKNNIEKRRRKRLLTRDKKFKERKKEIEDKIKKQAYKEKQEKISLFKEKYANIFGDKLLWIENINKKFFNEEEIEIGKELYEIQEIKIEKEEEKRKHKEDLKNRKLLVRKL